MILARDFPARLLDTPIIAVENSADWAIVKKRVLVPIFGVAVGSELFVGADI